MLLLTRKNRIKELCKSSGMTMEKLANQLHVSSSTVGQWANGKRQPFDSTKWKEYCGRKEFYQDAWDAFHSTLYTKDSSYNATITKIPVRPISEKRIEERLLYQKSNSKDWDPSAIEKFKQSRFYPFRLCLRKIGLPLLIMLYVAIWIGLAIFK